MHRHHAFLFPLAILGGLPLPALAAPGRIVLPPDSFINQHVASMSQMSQQVTLDPVVRRRLARHFHTSGPAVVRYIQNNLILKKTTTARYYQVYCISRTGREYTVNSRLPAGAPVFVMRATGKPILKLACGNPMVAVLPLVRTKINPNTPPELASVPMPAPIALAPKLAPNGPVVVVTNSRLGLVITSAPITRVAGLLQNLPARGSQFPIGLLGGIPIIASIVTHGGSSRSLVTFVTPIVPVIPVTPTVPVVPATPSILVPPVIPVTPSPVPEPSTTAAFAVGAAGLAFLLSRARRRRTTKN